MRATLLCVPLVLAGCLTTPALSHTQPMAANSAIDRSTTEGGIAASTDVAITIGHAMPVEGAKGIVVDLTGEAGLNHGAFAPGVWLRTGGQNRNEVHFGWRMGLASGIGDVGNYEKWRRPWAGPSTHLQLSSGWGNQGAFALTLGAEYTVPLLEELPDTEVEMIPALWVTLDARVEVETSETSAFFIGGGIGIDILLPVPYVGMGARF